MSKNIMKRIARVAFQEHSDKTQTCAALADIHSVRGLKDLVDFAIG